MVCSNLHQSLIAVCLLASVAILGSCARSGTTELARVETLPEMIVNDSDIDYVMIQKEIIEPSCIACHSAHSTHPKKRPSHFDTYEQVKMWTGLKKGILHRLTETPGSPMPPADDGFPAPDRSRIRALKRWKQLGYRRDRTRPDPEPTPKPTPKSTPRPTITPVPTAGLITYPLIQKELIQAQGCLDCHFDLESYDKVRTLAPEILQQIESQQMPPDCAKEKICVPIETIQLFKNWMVQDFRE